MANPEHLEILEQGVEVWNQWRKENPEVEPNLRGANLAGANLAGANLSGVTIAGANLSGATIAGANLTRANLSGADLADANLANAKLADANLAHVHLARANLSGANLADANLANAKLADATLTFATLIGANLSGAILYSATLIGANLRDATLSGAILRNANLYNTNLRDAILYKANLYNTNLERANLQYANLQDANFGGTNFSGTNLIGADLSGFTLIGSNFTDANLSYINAINTNFQGAILTGACIKDWHINADTNLQDVVCNYIYMGYEERDNKTYYTDRRPHDPTQNFAPGEFTKLFQKALSTVDLIFRNGINWEAFAYSFQQLQVKAGEADLSIQAIENKGDGDFIIRVNTPPEFDKAEVQRFIETTYQTTLKAIEDKLQVREQQLEQYRQENTNLWGIVKGLANKPTTIEINTSAMANADNQSKTTTFNQQGAKIANQAVDGGTAIGGQFNDYSTTINNNLDEITALIQSLHQLAQNFPKEQRDEVEDHLSDLQDDLKHPDKVKPSRLKATLGALLAIALTVGGVVATATDFANNVLELSNKLRVELARPQANQSTSPSPISSPQSTSPSLPPSVLPTVEVEVIDPLQ